MSEKLFFIRGCACAVDLPFTHFSPDTNMMEAKDPNDPTKSMFKVLQISLACPACMEAGRASECTHSKLELFFLPWLRVYCSSPFSLCAPFSVEKFRPPWKVSFFCLFSRHFQILLTRISNLHRVRASTPWSRPFTRRTRTCLSESRWVSVCLFYIFFYMPVLTHTS